MQGIATWTASAPAAERALPQGMDEAAFSTFHARTAAALRAYLAHASRQPALADDLVQEAYIRFLVAGRWQEGEAACRRFLFTIATNLLRDHFRRPAAMPLEQIPEPQIAPDSRWHPDAGMAGLDAAARLAPAWRQLKPRQRQLLWLAYVEGYTHREIAAITGLAAAGIRLLLFRARGKLAGCLEADTR